LKCSFAYLCHADTVRRSLSPPPALRPEPPAWRPTKSHSCGTDGMADGTGSIAWSKSAGRVTSPGPPGPLRPGGSDLPGRIQTLESTNSACLNAESAMEATSFAPDPSKCTVSASDVSLKLRGVSDSDNDFYTDTAETWPTPGRGTDSDAATATPSGAPDGSGEEALEAVSVEAALAAAASAVYVDPLGEDNVGRQLLLKMGWKQGKGLGLKGRGIREVCAITNAYARTHARTHARACIHTDVHFGAAHRP
jgi:hypothetical protein